MNAVSYCSVEYFLLPSFSLDLTAVFPFYARAYVETAGVQTHDVDDVS